MDEQEVEQKVVEIVANQMGTDKSQISRETSLNGWLTGIACATNG